MKKKYLLAAASLMAVLPICAQTPGGVGKPEVWSRDTATVRIPSASGMTYVGVSRVLADREQAIWSLGTGRKASRMQTTERAANLSDGTFMNYAQDSLPELRLYSYTTAARGDGSQTLHIGKAGDNTLPVSDLDGGTVEYAVYSRRLSDRERLRVESYLALKYGVSLRSSYLNGHGTVIWNAYANKAYGHRIAGIIADEPSALRQDRARSSEEGHFLTVKAGRPLSDGQSLLWGDDNGRLAFAASKAYGKWLGRKWKAAATDMPGTAIDITADSRQLRQIQPLAEGESYYLAVDSTGTGTFPVKTVQYHKAERDTGDSIVFRGIRPADGDVFTLRAAKDMFTTVEVSQPDETKGGTGSLGVRVTGGVPPYRMVLSRERSSVYDHTSGDSLRTVDGLAEGRYLLATTDRLGNVAENEFQISVTGITELPDDTSGDGADGYFARVKVSPNPTTDGNVAVQVEISDETPLTLSLRTSGGATVSTAVLPADTYFATRIKLPAIGVYLLTLEAGGHERTIRLIRK